MSNENMLIALGKVVVALAWADGEVTHDEVNNLKMMLFKLPNINAQQWAVLDMYLESPIDEAERNRLVKDLKRLISSRADKQYAINALKEMALADGVVTTEEKQMLQEIEAAIESVSTGALGGMMHFFKSTAKQHSAAPNREIYLEDFIKNKVYYKVQRRLELGQDSLNIPDAQLRKLCLAGGLMAQIAYIDRDVDEQEFATMVAALQNGWSINLEEATLIVEVAVSDEANTLKQFNLKNEFSKLCSTEELTQFLDILFAIATADGEASFEEIEEIRSMAKTFQLPHKYFIQAKKKVPREQRQQ